MANYHPEKRNMASGDSPIYSTINAAAEEDLLSYYDTYSSASYKQGPDPYSSSPALSNSGLVALEQDLDQWTAQSGNSTSEYAKLHYTKKSNGEWIAVFIYFIFFLNEDLTRLQNVLVKYLLLSWQPPGHCQVIV